MPLSDFPRFVLAHLPTPLEPLARLRQHIGGPRLCIKRDDCAGLALGGNKTRKAEFLIGAALAEGATVIVSQGGLQSNHVRQTAAAAAKAGLKCHLVLDHQVPIDTAIYRENGNLLLDRVRGAVTHLCAADETRADLIARLRAEGEAPQLYPGRRLQRNRRARLRGGRIGTAGAVERGRHLDRSRAIRHGIRRDAGRSRSRHGAG
jgi:L-cysteate sulfo-lyase